MFQHYPYFIQQDFPNLLPSKYADPKNPKKMCARSEVERRSEYFKKLEKLPENNGALQELIEMTKGCLQDEGSQRPDAQELLEKLKRVRFDYQLEMPYREMNRLEMVLQLEQHVSDFTNNACSSIKP